METTISDKTNDDIINKRTMEADAIKDTGLFNRRRSKKIENIYRNLEK